MSTAAGIQQPVYTQTPNVLLDELMPKMGDAELRVCLAIIRNTFGWQRQSHKMSLSYLGRATGLSRQGVLNGINAGIERGIIRRERDGRGYSYGLMVNEVDQQIVNEVDQPEAQIVNEVDQNSQRGRPKLVNEVDTTNKGKKGIQRKTAVGAAEGFVFVTEDPPIRQPTPTAAPAKPRRGRVTNDMIDLRKLGPDGMIPRGKGETPVEIWREFLSTPTKAQMKALTEEVDDLGAWRKTVEECRMWQFPTPARVLERYHEILKGDSNGQRIAAGQRSGPSLSHKAAKANGGWNRPERVVPTEADEREAERFIAFMAQQQRAGAAD